MLGALHPETTLVHGDCKTGLDRLADSLWRHLTGRPCERHPADWYRHDERCYHAPRPDGRCPAAGPRRNREMGDAGASLLVAFPGGRGTADMRTVAWERGVPILDVTCRPAGL